CRRSAYFRYGSLFDLDLVCFRALVRLFFFFQAEDGIRDFHVTGVQTCALPISSNPHLAAWAPRREVRIRRRAPNSVTSRSATRRSEERRVGKESSSRWRP